MPRVVFDAKSKIGLGFEIEPQQSSLSILLIVPLYEKIKLTAVHACFARSFYILGNITNSKQYCKT